ncbi:MAG: S-methyl-5-thioribose-1-phosphate isomerase [Anaerolineaceae bacterium]|nr:S-methyl-5-thioribose-1-phosphate isomerase [Anaerolineaceae bacterium]
MRTVSWNNGKIVLIDQTRLPNHFELIETDDIERVAEAIRRLEVRGAPAIGVTAAYAMALAALKSPATDKQSLSTDLQNAYELLAKTRPTATNLFWALDYMMAFAKKQLLIGSSGLGEAMLAEAQKMADEDVAINQRLAEIGSELIPDGARVLTHCNCGPLCAVDLGTAMAPVIYAHKQGKKIHVYTDETRPRLQGAKLNAWELAQAGVPYTLITDNTAAWVMSQKKVDLVMIGVDRVAANGDTAAKIGVYGLAVLAHYHHIPFYAVSPTSTIDMKVANGSQIPIEERDPDEVRKINDTWITMPEANVLNYAFDVTPNDLISAIVTEFGIVRPPYQPALTSMIQMQR